MENIQRAKMSRRNFLKGGAVGLTAFAAMGMLGGCASNGSATAEPPEKWDAEADVVVLGLGAAGSMAAAEAYLNGSSVIVLEKMDQANAGACTSCFAGNMMMPEPEWWPVVVNNSLGEIQEEDAKIRATAANEAWNWCIDNGVVMERNGYSIEGGAPALYEWITETMNSLDNVEIRYSTPAVELILDEETGEVRGVYADEDGNRIAVKAKKGVVIATGDYSSNPDLVATLHWPKLVTFSEAGPANTGDGIMMAAAAGAQLKYLANSCVDFSDFAFRKASEETGVSITSCWYSTPEYMIQTLKNPHQFSSVFVNMNGNRFMNEKLYMQHYKSHLPVLDMHNEINDPNKDYENLPMFMVCDDATIKAGPLSHLIVEDGDAPYMWNPVHNVYEWSDDNQAEIDKGWIIKADTLEELAGKMVAKSYITGEEKTVPAEALVAAIEKYNEGCESGVDEFGRPAEMLQPLSTPPYYAAEMCMSLLYTLGPLASTGNGEVLDWNNEPIGRLYCAGNSGQGSYLMASGISMCLGMGWAAGAHAASLEAWDQE